jgi:hypothetical protein
MIGLRTAGLFALVVGLAGCVIPVDDGRRGSYYGSSHYRNSGSAWRDGPRHYEYPRLDERRFEQHGERDRFDRR